MSAAGFWAPKKPRRLTITVNGNVFSALEARSTEEGRSMSNLASYLLERGLIPDRPTAQKP